MFDKKGVSPVVGTILLIAITVALAAIVATLVSGLGGRGTPPSAMLQVTAVDNLDNKVILTNSQVYFLANQQMSLYEYRRLYCTHGKSDL